VIAAHHGTVGVDSRPGQTRFTVTLPLLPGEADQQNPAAR
jgi:nitrogen-specific signal transduction histidine kinase